MDDVELAAVGAVPEDSHMPHDWDWDVAHLYLYQITPTTTVRFLSQRYRMIYLLDLSPSATAVSTSQSVTAVERLIPALRNSLEGAARPFCVPGSQLLITPDIYVTIIAWTPFLTSDAQLVIHQGWHAKEDNIDHLIESVIENLHRLEERIAHVNSSVQADLAATRAEASRLLGGLFEASPPPPTFPSTPVATSDAGFVNMIKTGMLALQLLPKNSAAGLYVVSDGSLTLPDVETCDVLLGQLRTKTISLSFLQVTSSHVPESGLSRVPYNDFLNFIACSTYGCYLPDCPRVHKREYVYDINLYHESFFCWTFKKALHGVKMNPGKCELLVTDNSFFQGDVDSESGEEEEEEIDHEIEHRDASGGGCDENGDGDDGGEEGDDEGWVEGNRQKRCVVHNEVEVAKSDADAEFKQSWEGELCSSLLSVLSCRLREGYTVNEVAIDPIDSVIELKLSLPWKMSSLIHYIIVAPWPPHSNAINSDMKPKVYVFLEGEYDTVRDVVVMEDRGVAAESSFRSATRAAVVQKFFTTIQHLTRVDRLLVHLDSFASNPLNFTVPESVSGGIPLFQLPTVQDVDHLPVVASLAMDLRSEFGGTPFAAFWRPVCCLDINIWHRWLHTHRINITLNHDSPLPKHFVTPNSSGRYTNVQCRKAAAKVCNLLKEEASFTLVENVSYIKFLYCDDSSHKEPSSFYIIRLTSKPPCVVIWLAFPGGTAGSIRYRELDRMKEKLQHLMIKQHIHWRDPKSTYSSSGHRFRAIVSKEESIEQKAMSIMVKPVEKILVRYERVPRDFFNLLEPAYVISNSRTSSPIFSNSNGKRDKYSSSRQIHGGVFLILARYLSHERWLWNLKVAMDRQSSAAAIPLSPSAVVRIHSTLVRTRLLQGFYFAHSKNGIQGCANG